MTVGEMIEQLEKYNKTERIYLDVTFETWAECATNFFITEIIREEGEDYVTIKCSAN